MVKKKPDEKNLHEGHRARVLNSYSRIDLDALSPHQVMEFILFYVFPRGDVNPLAHRLLDAYGSVQNVLDANPNELAKIYGINQRSAQMITGFPKIFNYYTSSKLSKKYFFASNEDVYDYCEDLLRFYPEEVFFIVGADASFHVIAHRLLGKGANRAVQVDTRLICDFINETKSANIVLTHSHPGGFSNPTDNDIDGTEIIKKVVQFMHCNYIDHIIVGADGVFSLEKNEKVRNFSTNENIREFANAIKNNDFTE